MGGQRWAGRLLYGLVGWSMGGWAGRRVHLSGRAAECRADPLSGELSVSSQLIGIHPESQGRTQASYSYMRTSCSYDDFIRHVTKL